MTKKVLIFQGGWDGHQPAELALRFAAALKTRSMDATIRDNLECLDNADDLRTYDLIIPCWTMGQLSKEREKNLCAAVAAGTGLGGIHGTMGDAFRGSIDYEWMVGGHFVAHPHVGDYMVNVIQPDHPLTVDLPARFPYTSEQYYMQVDPGVNVLLETEYDLGTGTVAMPVAWTKRWGSGRVFYSALGHVPAEFDAHPAVWAFTIRGLCWAAR